MSFQIVFSSNGFLLEEFFSTSDPFSDFCFTFLVALPTPYALTHASLPIGRQ